MRLEERKASFPEEVLQEIRKDQHTFNELQKVSGIRFSGMQEAEKELAVGQKELLPAVKGGRCDPEIIADLADSTAPAQISFENLKHEPESVLAIRHQEVLQKGMGVTAGALDAEDGNLEDNGPAIPEIDNVTAVSAMRLELAPGSAGRAVPEGKVRVIRQGVKRNGRFSNHPGIAK